MKGKTLLRIGNWAVKNKRMLLTVGSITGVAITMLVTAKSAIKAKEELDILENDYEDEMLDEKSYKKEKAIIIAKNSAGPLACGIMTSVAIGSNQKIATTEIAGALASADYISKKYENLENKLKEKVGEDKVKEAKREITKERCQEAAKNIDLTCVMQIGKGQTLFFDDLSGQLFRSSTGEIKDIVRDFNQYELRDYDWLSANYWLDYFGLHKMSDQIGDTFGFQEKYDQDGLTVYFEPGEFILPNGETPTIMKIRERLCTEGDFRAADTM